MLRIVSLLEHDVPSDLRIQVRALQRQAWPNDEPLEPGPIHDPLLRPLSMLLVEDGSVLSALDVLSKDILHRGERFAASGLSTVVTDENHRRRGYGHRLVVAARHLIEESGADLGIFTCDVSLQPFYERAGWEVMPGTVLIGGTPGAPFPSDQSEKVTMTCFFSERAAERRSTFLRARVELHPGTIDKLW